MEFLTVLHDTPLPTILVILGAFFLFLSLVEKAGRQIKTSDQGRKWAFGIGGLMLTLGIVLYQGPAQLPPPVTPTAAVETETSVSPSPATTETLNSPVIPSSTPVLTDTSTPICLLEDFENGRKLNWWAFDPSIFQYNETSEQAHSGAHSFKVKYTKTDTYQFIGAELPSGMCDFTKGRTLQMWVYGKVTFLLKLEDQNRYEVEVSEQSATNTTDWTLIIFSYTDAGSVIDLGRVRSIFLFPAPGDPLATGEILVDDVAVFP